MGVDRVAVQVEVALAQEEALLAVQEVPADLHHPLAVRLRHDPGHLDPPRAELDYEQDAEAHETGHGQNLDGEEVAAAIASQCEARNVRQDVRFPRSGAGSVPCSRRISCTVDRATSWRRLPRASRILV